MLSKSLSRDFFSSAVSSSRASSAKFSTSLMSIKMIIAKCFLLTNQCLDSLFNWGVGGEEAADFFSDSGTFRVRDVKMRDSAGLAMHWLTILGNFSQRIGQSFRIAGKQSTRCVRQKFSSARNRQLNKHRKNRRQN